MLIFLFWIMNDIIFCVLCIRIVIDMCYVLYRIISIICVVVGIFVLVFVVFVVNKWWKNLFCLGIYCKLNDIVFL